MQAQSTTHSFTVKFSTQIIHLFNFTQGGNSHEQL